MNDLQFHVNKGSITGLAIDMGIIQVQNTTGRDLIVKIEFVRDWSAIWRAYMATVPKPEPVICKYCDGTEFLHIMSQSGEYYRACPWCFID